MDALICFRGADGLDRKVRTIAARCKGGTRDMPRTLLLTVTAPDPKTTPDCQHAEPRVFWINQLDSNTSARSVAEMLGSMQSLIDSMEHNYVSEFGEGFRDLVDEARGRGHALQKNTVVTEPIPAGPWLSR